MDNVIHTPQQDYTAFCTAAHTKLTKAEDGTYRGQRHGAFTAAVAVAASAIAKLQPGFYPVRTISAQASTPGWALRVAAKRDESGRVELLSGGRGNASMIHVK